VTPNPRPAPTSLPDGERKRRRRRRVRPRGLLDLRLAVPTATGLGWAATIVAMATAPSGSPARVAMLLLAGLCACLLAATAGVRALPVINAAAAVIIGGLLWTQPAVGEPAPAVDSYAWAELVAVHAIVVVSTIQLTMHQRRTGPAHRAGPDTVQDPKGQAAPGRADRCPSADGPGCGPSAAPADRLVGAAHALRRTRRRFLLVFGNRPPGAGDAATQLRLAASLIEMAVMPLRRPAQMAVRAAVILGCPVGLVALACAVPPSVTSLWIFPLAFTSWCAASWLLGRRPARQRRLVPVRLRRAQLAPRGTPQRLRQEAQLVHDNIRAADRIVQQMLAGLPDPAADSGPDSRRDRSRCAAAAALRQAQTSLTCASNAVDLHLAQTLPAATQHPGGGRP
jgi:hypothetical protein